MKKHLINIKELIKGIAISCSYPILASLIAVPFYFLHSLNIISKQTLYLIVYSLLAIVFLTIYHKDFIADLKSFKTNYKYIIKTSLKYWFIGLIIMLISSNIISLFNLPINSNQQENIEILKSMPFFEITCACFLAPLIEEHVYRKSLSKFTQNKHLYAFISGIIFALAHITSSLNTPNSFIMLVYLIPYSALGIAFGYAYNKTKNICGNIFVHALHNTISIIELLIIIALGGTL